MIRITVHENTNVDIGVPKDARVQIVRGKEIIRPPQKAWIAGVVNADLQKGDRLEVACA